MNKRILGLMAVAIVILTALACSSLHAPSVRNAPASSQPAMVADCRGYAYAGLPKIEHPVVVLRNIGYVAGYSEQRRDPLWVCYRVFRVENESAPPRPSGFRVDERTHARVSPEDYKATGYDRGHMAPNYAIATRYGTEAQRETFLMSNIVPQTPQLNRGLWQRLETLIARTYAQEYEQVWVIAGPVYSREARALGSGVDIPVSCYGIVLDEVNGAPRVMAFVIPQDVPPDAKLEGYLQSVDDIEAMTGLDFMAGVPDEVEVRLEAQRAACLWN